jgi:hypothetical protein
VICGVISCESDDLITNLLQLTQNSKSDKKNGARNFDSATVFYEHQFAHYYAVAKCHFEGSEF